MESYSTLLKRKAAVIVGIGIVATLFAATRLPELPESERGALAAKFRFASTSLPEDADVNKRNVRPVHPSLKRINAWISSVGAAAALGDADGDGLPNDLCHVDPRNDSLSLAPVPGTSARYSRFMLAPRSSKYDETMAPMGCILTDLNEDGRTDALVYYWGRTPIAFLRTGATLDREAFTEKEIVTTGERWFTNAATTADFDGDGHLDIYIGNYFQDGGKILDSKADGLEVMHDTKSKSSNGGRDRLLLWKSAGPDSVAFEEARGAIDESMARGWALAVGASDLDGDSLPELYVGNDFGPDRLWHNQSTPGKPKFALISGSRDLRTPASLVLGQDSFKGMGVDFGDVNGDGQIDIHVSNIADEFALQESHVMWMNTGNPELLRKGVATFRNASESLGVSRSGWGWDVRIADFNNDSVPEILHATGFMKGTINRWAELQALGTGNDAMMKDPRAWPGFRPGDDVSGNNAKAFFARSGNGRYFDIAPELGLDNRTPARAIAIADVDGDGRLDYVMAHQWATSFFHKNESASGGSFLGLHLRLPLEASQSTRIRTGHPGADTPGRPAIGATARVRLPDGRTLIAQADGGSGHSGKRSPDVHFGLGSVPANTPVPVDITWRGASGELHNETVRVTPGWHTVQLASRK